jgi:hypothetical protein
MDVLQMAELAPFLEGADHVDVKVVEGRVTLREFIAGMLSYQPDWVTFLYHVRGVFVRLLGMRQEGVPHAPQMAPEEVPMTPGESAFFFTVRVAQEDRYWVAGGDDTHLSAELGVVAERLEDGLRRFHVVTIVHYNNLAGPVYFNVIRPFHHLVVRQMAQRAVQGERGQKDG